MINLIKPNIRRLLAKTLLVISFASYLLGILLPMFTNTRFFFFEKEFSLLSSISHLFDSEEYFLSVLVMLFSLILPLFKYFLLFEALLDIANERLHKFIGFISKWAMLDVFIMALAVVFYKFSMGILEFSFEIGAYFFIGSVMVSMGASVLLGLKNDH